MTLTTILAVPVAGAVLLGLAYLAIRHCVAMVALLLGVWLVTTAIRDPIDLSITISTTRVMALDVIAAILAAVAVARSSVQGVRTLGRGLVFALLALLVLHIARGVVESGLQTGFNNARPWLYFTAAMAYAATIPGAWDGRVWKVLTVAGLGAAALAVPYFVVDGVHSSSALIDQDGELVNWRPVLALGGLLVVQAAILALALQWPTHRAAICSAIAAGVVVLLLQHRTVWLAALLAGIVAVGWWARTQDRRRVVALVAAALVLALVPAAIWGSGHAGALVDSIKEPATGNSTLGWRTDGWGQLISSNDSPTEILVGNPSGQGFERAFRNAPDVSAHNEYLDAYVRFGFPAVVVLCCLALLLWLRRVEIAAATNLTPHAISLLLLTQLVFSLPYSLDFVQGLILGVFVSGLAVTSRAPSPSDSRSSAGSAQTAAQ